MNVQPFGPGVTLVAGPEHMPLTDALAAARASGARVYVLGAEPRELTARDLGTVELGSLEALPDWLDALPGPAIVVLHHAGSLPGWLATERPEDRLLRLLDEVRLRDDAGLVLLEPLPLDRLSAPDQTMSRLLARSDRRLLCTADGLLPADGVLASRGHPALPRDALAHEAWLYLAVTAVCALAIAVALRPTLLGPHTGMRLLGDVSDGLPRNLWLNSWLAEQLRQGGSWIETRQIFWPLGANVVATFGNIAANLLATPFLTLLGFPLYWNVYVGTALLCNGVAMGWLARDQGADRVGAVLAALSFSVAPPLLREVGRADPAVLWAAPFLLAVGLCLRATRGDRRDAMLAGLSLALTSVFWWYYGLFAAVIGISVAIARGLRAPATRAHLLGQAGMVLRLWAPVVVAALPALAVANRGHLYDLGELYLPGANGPSFAATLAFDRMTSDVLALDQLLAVPSGSLRWGASVLVLGVLGAWLVAHRGARLFWAGVAIVSAVLALGPWLSPSWGMASGWLPLPLRGLQVLFPPLEWLDRPDRLLVLTAMALSITLGLLWYPLSRRLAAARRPAALGVAVVGVALVPMFSGTLPVAAFDYAPPGWTRQITKPGAIIHVPLGWSEASTLWAPLHGRAVAGGPDEVVAMRDPTPYSNAVEQTPALAFFRDLDRGRMGPEERRWLLDQGAAYVVVETDFMRRLMRSGEGPEYDMLDPLMDRIDVTFGPAIYDANGVRLYEITDSR